MSYQIIFTDSLSHHGIKGQRWGIRRFRNRDGTLKEAGKKRYNSGKKRSMHRLDLEQKYIRSGMSKEDAERAADKKIKIEKGIAITAAAAATTVAAIAIYKKVGKEYADRTIKSGSKISTLSLDKDRITNISGANNDHFYAAINKKDREKYRGLFGASKVNNKPVVKFNIESVAKSDVKIASPQNAKKEFIEVFKKNPEYEKYLRDISKGNDREVARQARRVFSKADSGKKLTDKDIGKLYSMFNVALPLTKDQGKPSGIDEKFFDALKKKGYSGVIDVNDLRYSKNLKSHSPTIIFDKSKFNLQKANEIKQLTDEEIAYAFLKQTPGLITRSTYGKTAIAVGAASTAKYLNDFMDDKIIEEYKDKKKK